MKAAESCGGAAPLPLTHPGRADREVAAAAVPAGGGRGGGTSAVRGAPWVLSARPPPPGHPTYHHRRAPDGKEEHQQHPPAGPHGPGASGPPGGRWLALAAPLRTAGPGSLPPRSRSSLWAAGEAPAARRHQTPPPSPAARGHAQP